MATMEAGVGQAVHNDASEALTPRARRDPFGGWASWSVATVSHELVKMLLLCALIGFVFLEVLRRADLKSTPMLRAQHTGASVWAGGAESEYVAARPADAAALRTTTPPSAVRGELPMTPRSKHVPARPAAAAATPRTTIPPSAVRGELPMIPHMGASDLARLYEIMSRAKFYREFGCGGSTVQSLGFPNIEKIVSTEGDQGFVNTLQGRADIRHAISTGRMVLQHAYIGPVGAWSRPKDRSAIRKWPEYSFMNASIREFNPPVSFDTVFVDGRFRVACLLRAIQASLQSQHYETIFAIHDYTNRREQYGIVERFLKPFKVDGSSWMQKAQNDIVLRKSLTRFDPPEDFIMATFTVRPNVDARKLDAAIGKYELNPDRL